MTRMATCPYCGARCTPGTLHQCAIRGEVLVPFPPPTAVRQSTSTPVAAGKDFRTALQDALKTRPWLRCSGCGERFKPMRLVRKNHDVCAECQIRLTGRVYDE
jgi:hypothetical protein